MPCQIPCPKMAYWRSPISGMGISVTKVNQESEARKNAVPPMPKIKRRVIAVPFETAVKVIEVELAKDPGAIIPITNTPKDAILKDLYDQLGQVMRDRHVLSSETAKIVERIREHLSAESKGVAEEFMRGNLPATELKSHYERIQACTNLAIALKDKIKFVESHGVLPVIQEPQGPSKDEDVLKARLRTVIDALSKTRKKLKEGKSYNPSRIIIWEEKVALLEAQQTELQGQIKKLQIDVRNSREG
jgi:hypothetical protein